MGLITDTGRFMYENTGRRAHLMAADLIDGGVDVHDLYRRVYEGVPYGKLALLARGLANIERYDDGRLTVTALTAIDFKDSDAEESYSEGVIDHLRAVQGTAVAALIRERINNGGGNKVSLRASDDRVDVSAIARAQGGGGHRQAAGFTTELSHDELVRFLLDQLAAQLERRAQPGEGLMRPMNDYVLLCDKPAGVTSHDVVARIRRELPRRTKVGHAGTLDPFATGLLLVLVGRATRVQRFLMELPKRYEATARFGAVSSTGDPEGEIAVTGVVPEGDLRVAGRPASPAAACLLGRQGGRASAHTGSPARGSRWSCPSARSRCIGSRSAGATANAAASRSSARRGPTCAR